MTATPRARVLLVDDNRELAENLQEILADEDVLADIAHDGQPALEMLESERYDLVITDVRMPGMDGIQLLQAIRQRWPQLPVVIMSAWAGDEHLRQAAAAGALEVSSKPVDITHIIDLVGRIAAPNAPILVLEDDPGLRSNLCEALLAVAGVLPHPAADLAAARRLSNAVDFRVAIVDVRLPDGNGLDFGRELSLRSGDRLALVYITGYAAELHDELHEARDSAQIHVLEKPFAPELLLALVRRAI